MLGKEIEAFLGLAGQLISLARLVSPGSAKDLVSKIK